MMKILFLLVVLANLCLFLWEYRTGAFASSEETQKIQQDVSSVGQIVLVGEAKKPNNESTQPINKSDAASSVEQSGSSSDTKPTP